MTESKPFFFKDAPSFSSSRGKGASSSSVDVEKDPVPSSAPPSLEDDDPVTTDVKTSLLTTPPYQFIGLLTFSFDGQSDYCGTAFLIGNSTILTAAHNIQNSGIRSTGFTFQTGYYYDTSAQKENFLHSFPSQKDKNNLDLAVVSPQWSTVDDLNRSLPYDYGIITLGPDTVSGKTAGEAVGGFLQLQYSTPDKSPFTITEIQFRQKDTAQQNVGLSNGLLKYTGGGNSFIKDGTTGSPFSAGAPWFTNSGLKANTVFGFTSTMDTEQQLDYSPLFDEDFQKFIQNNVDSSTDSSSGSSTVTTSTTTESS